MDVVDVDDRWTCDGHDHLHSIVGINAGFRVDGCSQLGHGAFIALGHMGLSVIMPLTPWVEASSVLLNAAVFALALCAGVIVAGLVGLVFDRLLIRPVYGNHLKQILMTTGGLIIVEQLIRAIWAPKQFLSTCQQVCADRGYLARRRLKDIA
jgi:branched-subunit amino acid ABC-type transport system permease component